MQRFLRMLAEFSPIRFWAMIGVYGPAFIIVAGILIYLIDSATWPQVLAPQQLQALSIALYIVLALLGVIMIALAMVRVHLTGPAGTSFEGETADNRPQPPPTRATATVTVESPTAKGTGQNQ